MGARFTGLQQLSVMMALFGSTLIMRLGNGTSSLKFQNQRRSRMNPNIQFDEPVSFIPFNKEQTLVLFDGDVLCFIACPPRDYMDNRKKRKDDFEVVETEVFIGASESYTVSVKEEKITKKLPSEYTAEENERYYDACWENLQNNIISTRESLDADGFLMAVKGPGNYRDEMYPEYKANRKKNPEHQNLFVPKLREELVSVNLAIASFGRETDDLLRIWSQEAIAAGDRFIIATIDKDLDMIPGKHYHLKKSILYTSTEKFSTRFFYEQLLKGDPTDNIPGIPGVGPKKAEAFLEPYDTEQEFQAAVIDAYKTAFENDWEGQLLANGKLLYLQKAPDDYFNIRGWARFEE
jgi:hypothetical protein